MAGVSIPEEKTTSNDELNKQRDALKLDTILAEEVGQFGCYQLRVILLAALPALFSAFGSAEYIFTTARVNTRCRIPQCDGSASAVPLPEFRPEWVLNAINGTSRDSFEACSRFPDQLPQTPSNDTCPVNWFDRSRKDDCDDFIYEHTNSVVYDFQMACQEWKRSLIGSVQMAGAFMSLPLTGFVSDRWGRRAALVIFALQSLWSGIALSFVNSYEWYLFFKIMTTLAGGLYSTAYILVAEIVGPRYRVLAGAWVSSYFALGNVLVAVIAWRVQPWRQLTRALHLPQVVCVAYYWLIPDSVRWLLSKGWYKEAEGILQKAAKVNKTQLSEKSLELLRSATDAEKKVEVPKEPLLVLLVLKSRTILARCVVVPIWWITDTLVYYGLSVNAVNLSGNVYLNYVCVSAVEIPGFWTSVLLMDRVGRRPLLVGGYLCCALCQLGYPFIPQDMAALSTAVYLFGKFCISMVISCVYVYTTELFPTQHRHRMFAFVSMLGRIGNIVAPLTPSLAQEVWAPLPSVLFGSFALLSGLLVFTMPETMGAKLPDTMQEAEDLSKRQK